MSADSLLQPEPATRDGVAWTVFEHLVDKDIQDPSAIQKMTHEQRLVFAINMLRQEVGHGGFDSYFRYTGGNTGLVALDAAELLGAPWIALVRAALHALGSPYPRDVHERERVLDQLAGHSPQLLAGLDEQLYELEAEHPADEVLDQFIWSHTPSFFV